MTQKQTVAEIGRFTGDGKTFFFNECEARNGQPYLGINTLWGRGNQERLVIFPSQMMQFLKLMRRSVSEIAGMTPSRPISETCPECGAGTEYWYPVTGKGGKAEYWYLYCRNCQHVIAQSHEDSVEQLEED